MKTEKVVRRATISIVVLGAATSNVYGYDFTVGDGTLQGSWVTNLTAGAGIRTKNPSCSLTGDPNAYGCGAAANTDQWGYGDNGDLNYRKGQPFSTYVSATSELLLKMPREGLKFMVRGTGMYDFLAGNTARTPLSSTASAQVVYNAQLLDLWAQKDFTIGGQNAHVRFGNQVINWGESMFAQGGINATNSLDVQKLLIPGSQLKQALLPAPMVSVAANLSHGFSTEAYYQFQWNGNRYPPVGSYWSVTNGFGRGAEPFTLNTNNLNVSGPSAGTIAGSNSGNQDTLNATKNGLVNGTYAGPPFNDIGLPVSWQPPSKYKPQFGVKFNYSPRSFDANFAFYYVNYTDKSPVLSSLANGTEQWSYLQNRQLFGVSANFGVGPWAIGTELSYRPHDAVALSNCYGAGGPLDLNTNGVPGADCQQWIDKKKFQYDINGLLALTRSEYPFLKWLGADSATLTWELTWIYYPGLSSSGITRTLNGQAVNQVPAAGYFPWLNYGSGMGYPIAAGRGTASSVGATIDFNWTYDGTLIRGWQVTPGVTFSDGLYGYTPTFAANYSQGAKSVNVYVLFNQNPPTWQAGINFTAFFGGHQTVGQPYADRNFVGLFVTRNF
ncbi:DUF1302 domain-containing protein [Burkholderia multivorans]|uniref:DUF1302 domain-containing protein n=1 Tax=Burkholderia multivorans TaxID=87883 RepID=UPI0002780C83|nr:DUF1302 domain-containing protein [Burkholderia multivorans]EJO56351.1 PF06980 family protein [Burkholderia multivorans CF2]MBJ9653230.1 DUF1302 domain-containing protein [Burkholderia multivorans]MBR8043603.1 DUF1302 domain-containing protein [Burkholderia multivorans]MBU9435251.1 DUF1302 domain-containing protein [Burkholderia multivorans]MBU9469477.1 DUF1302 domain-containing protein [Burkholderia multivorans]